jgi:NAD(P)-dependent dehydrogenase (short-subunit alcohol dehydrogenase family)
LCNCAGLCHYSRSEECDISQWNKIIAINLTGPFILSRAVLTYLVEAKGAIVNIASMAGLLGIPYGAAYSASKGGLVLMTKALAKEFSDRNVRVNAVCPGAIATSMMEIPFPEDANKAMLRLVPLTPAGASTPEEVAATVAMLGSRECPTLTGCILTIDGGST